MTDNALSVSLSCMPKSNQILKIFRFIIFLVYLSACILTFLAIYIAHKDIWSRRTQIAKTISFYSSLALKMMGIQIQTQNVTINTNCLIVSNHLSYLDILIIAAQHPCVFVTSIEIKNTPVLGQLTELGGCLYVERRNKDNLNNEIADITNGLKYGLNVCIFPEATSTNGDSVLRFRSPLFNAAIQSKKPVMTLCMNYRLINNEPVTQKNRDIIAWYDDMTFLPHLLGVMGAETIKVDLDHGKIFSTDPEDDPKVLAARSQTEVEKLFSPILPG